MPSVPHDGPQDLGDDAGLASDGLLLVCEVQPESARVDAQPAQGLWLLMHTTCRARHTHTHTRTRTHTRTWM
jgi:hypothetical protein